MKFDLRNWKYPNLKKFLENPLTMEGLDYDFKEKIPDTRDEKGKRRLRESFCAFANSDGGYIFFGIDNNKRPKGIYESDYEFETKLNRIVTKKILPSIPVSNWQIAKDINLPRSDGVVFVVHIFPSLSIDKPHMTSERIFIREHGETKALDDGRDVQKLFAVKFNRYNIKELEYDLEEIKECRFTPDEIDVIYLKQLKHYLENQIKKRIPGFHSLDSKLDRIMQLYEEIKKEMSEGYRTNQASNVLNSEKLMKKEGLLGSSVKEFLKEYKNLHNIP